MNTNQQVTAGRELTSIDRAAEWLNSRPLTAADLRGRVVVVDFWTYTCINWVRSLPYVRAWDDKYRKQGLVVVGVHSPEFAFERNVDNVHRAVADMQVDYPIAIDNDYTIWRSGALSATTTGRLSTSWIRRAASDITGSVRVSTNGQNESSKSC